jgi:putative DNA primase/helicase
MSKLRVANNTDTAALPKQRAIALLGGRIEQNLDEIEQALLEQRIGIFQRNGDLVMPGSVSIEVRDGETIAAIGLIEVSAGSLVEVITSAAMLAKYDGRSKGMVRVNCPPQIADAYMKRKGRWGLRPLTGIANAPTLRPDGSLLDQPGMIRRLVCFTSRSRASYSHQSPRAPHGLTRSTHWQCSRN